MIVMWLSELITEKGIGQGASLVIFLNIVATLPKALSSTIEKAQTGDRGDVLGIAVLLGVFLLTIVGKLTGYTPRYFIHIIGDTHIYENHIDAVQEQLLRIPMKFPTIHLKEFQELKEITEEHFTIEDYQFYPTIKAEMVP